MSRLSLLLPLLLLVPAAAGAQTYASHVPEDPEAGPSQYLAASNVHIAQPVPADLVTAAGTLTVDAPVAGDVLGAAGTLSVRQGAAGDVRVAGGRVRIAGDVGGDIAAAGGTLGIFGSARAIYGAAGSIDVEASSTGAVRLYGGDITLGGTYGGDVAVVASNHLTLLPGTHIHGTFRYSAPEQLAIPDSVVIDGGAQYTGAYAYVPTREQVHQYALAGAGIFFLVRVLAGSIVAGLLAGLFPRAALAVADSVLSRDPLRVLKLLLLGLACGLFGPVLIIFLFVSLVGAGLSLLLSVLYALLILLAYASTGIVLGRLLRRAFLNRVYGTEESVWQDAIVGTVLIHIAGLMPVIGTFAVFLFAAACGGALVAIAFRAAFPALPARLSRATLRAYDDHV